MAKQDIIDNLAAAQNTSKKAAGELFELVLDGIVADLKENKELTLRGFGTFKVVERKARDGFNPQTQKKIKIAARTAVTFRASKSLTERC